MFGVGCRAAKSVSRVQPIKYASCLRIEFRMNHPTMCASEQVQKRKPMSAALISAKDRVTNFIPRRLSHVMPTALFQH